MQTLSIATVAVLALAAFLYAAEPAVGPTGRQDLMGPWQVHVVPNDPEQAKPAALEKADWHDVTAPFQLGHATGIGQAPPEQVHYAWARRTFTAPTEAQYRNALLHLHGVRWGSEIRLNGKVVGGHLGAYGAFEFDVTDAIRWGEKNELVIRLTGYAALPLSAEETMGTGRRMPLMPHGPALFGWGNRSTGIVGGLWIDYFDYARMERVQIVGTPDGKVRVRGNTRNYAPHFGQRTVRVIIRDSEGRFATRGQVELPSRYSEFSPRTLCEFETELKVANAKPWSPESPTLYQAELQLVQDGQVLDRWGESFGLRTFEARSGGFFLNGRRTFLRGICMWGEASGWSAAMTTDPRMVKRYLVDLPRGMNLNAIRHHTIPLDNLWLDVADRNGMLILQEFPQTINYRRPVLTEDERRTYFGRVLSEFESLLPLYWNHPSVVVWVESNEPGKDYEEFDNGPLYRLFHDADPTRPVMRSGEQSNDIYDTHCYSGFWHGSEGQFAMAAAEQAKVGRTTGKPIGNTEYIENFSRGRVTKWMGNRPADVSEREWELRRQDVYAQVVAEQTESLRRLGYDATIPYAMGSGYIGEFRDLERQPELRPVYFALRSAQAPVLASIELANRHFIAGQKVKTQVVLCDDTGSGRSQAVTLRIFDQDPGFEAQADARPLWQQNHVLPRTDAGAWRRMLDVSWPMPAEPGRYFLTATTEPGAVSRRIAWVLPALQASILDGRKVAVLCDDDLPERIRTLAPKCQIAAREQADVLLIGPMAHQRPDELKGVLEFARAGGRVIVLEQDRPLPVLALEVPRTDSMGGASTAFRTAARDHYAWRGLGDDDRVLRRFNGPSGALVRVPMQPADGDTVLLSASQGSGDLGWAAMVSRRVGKGEVIFCQLRLQHHLDGPDVDPVAQHILVNLLAK